MKESKIYNKSQWFKSIPIAHRGLHLGREIPENSFASFEAAIEKNYAIEIDVHMLKDGELVVFHDTDLKRMTGQNVSLYDCTSAELSTLKLYETTERIPLFYDFLKFVKGRVPVNIEIKVPKHNGDLEKKLMRELSHYKGEFAVQSFNPISLSWFKKHHPEVSRGLLSGSFDDENIPEWKKILLRNMVFLPQIRPDFIGYEFDHLESTPVAFIRQYTKIPIIAWTIRNSDDHQKSLPLCDNIIFENISP